MERKGPKLIFSETQDGKLLLEHLANIGIEDTALKWFTAYLSDWKQFIQGKIIRLIRLSALNSGFILWSPLIWTTVMPFSLLSGVDGAELCSKSPPYVSDLLHPYTPSYTFCSASAAPQ